MSPPPDAGPPPAAPPPLASPGAQPVRLPAEMLSVLSLQHLSTETQRRLTHDLLSLNAYPLSCGGLVFVGRPMDRRPTEPDLAALCEAAHAAGIRWLLFDRDVEPTPGLPVLAPPGPLD